MQNRKAFIDFAQGLLNLNPLERWTPAQAKLHPFITQQKFTGPFVPPMMLRPGNSKSPAPGVQEQQRAEAMSKQRQQQQVQQQMAAQAQAQAHAQAQAQAQNAAYMQQMAAASYAAQSPMSAQPSPGGYALYNTNAAPPPYGQQSGYPTQPMGLMPGQQQVGRYAPQQPQNLYPQAGARAGRPRASTMDQQAHQSGIPPALQRVMGHLDPNAPIRLQPSPAYYPPPPDGAPESAGSSSGNNKRRGSGKGGPSSRGNRDFIRTLEDQTLDDSYSQGRW